MNQLSLQGEFTEKLSHIRLLALDFDGTFTDGFVYVAEDGTETVRCSRRDSLGIEMLKNAGVFVCIISKETNPVVSLRCQKMGVPCFQSVFTGEGKREILKRFSEERCLLPPEVAYMGDDVNDVSALQFAGVGITVADGRKEVKDASDYVTSARGGEHAVREVCDMILAAKKIQPHC